jgi:uncharacterized damage-inducible protein DinB
MEIIDLFLKETEQEAQNTRKMFERVPNDKLDWQPHPKSMTIRQLATHIAELPSWIGIAITTDELDFAKKPYQPVNINNTAELSEYFEKNYEEGKAYLASTNEDTLNQSWVMRNGDYIIMTRSKAEVIRVSISQTIHHRAQLGVYLRLLNIPIPGSYGPSADELELQREMQDQ